MLIHMEQIIDIPHNLIILTEPYSLYFYDDTCAEVHVWDFGHAVDILWPHAYKAKKFYGV
jgi:hypothetical protein